MDANPRDIHEARAVPKKRVFDHPVLRGKKNILFILGAIVVVAVLVILFVGGGGRTRSESYKESSGVAGLQAHITYDVQCDKQTCDQKPTFNFNVYIFGNDGGQVAIVQPDKDGKVNAALPEGDYIMLIGKQLGKDKVFPQEPLALKNGQSLELKLHYR